MSECVTPDRCVHAQLVEHRRAGKALAEQCRCTLTGILARVRCMRFRPVPILLRPREVA